MGEKREHAAVVELPAVPVPIIGSDPNWLGETLRQLTFPGDKYGCYETFDVREDAALLPHSEAHRFFAEAVFADPDYDDLPPECYWGYVYSLPGEVTVECFWYWDGDGDLNFRISASGQVLRIIGNDDCKKAYEWRDIEPPRSGSSSQGGRSDG